MSEKEKEDFRLWDSERVGVWLVENGFDDYKDNFLEHKITGDLLLDLNYHALLEIGVIIVGDRARILQAIKRQFNKEKTTTPKGLYQRSSIPKQLSGEIESDTKKENRASFDLKKYENRNSFDIKKYEGLKSVENVPDNVSNSPKQIRKINVNSPVSIPKPIRDSPMLKEPGPIIINRSRENSASRELHIPTKLDIDSHQQAFRNQRTGVSQLKILPRSSSMKDSKEKKSNHQDLNEAMQSVFGISTTSNHSTPTYANSTTFSTVNSAASTILGFNIPTPTQSVLGSEAGSTLTPLPIPPERNIMDYQRVRENCIKVHGLEHQHVIKVAGLKDASAIRKRIFLKFGVVENSENKWDLFALIDDNLILLDDKELLKICATDNELRSNIHLRQTATRQETEPEVEPKSIQKLQKFFGESPSSGDPLKKLSKKETKASVKGPARSTSLFNQNNSRPTPSSKNKNLIAFFGERPPDEMIVDQLEKFFPGINLAKEEGKNSHNSVDIKNMVQANLLNKRTSKRESSFMLRRMSRQSDIKLSQRPQAIVVKPSDLSKSITMAELQKIQEEDKNTLDSLGSDVNTIGSQNTNTIESQSESEPPKMEKKQKKIDWTLGELIGQGAFGKVFMAINLANYEFMAVKQVLLGMDNPQEKKSADSLKHEIELLSELNHDNIVRYIGFESKQDSVNVFLEYVSGGSISSCLTKYGKFPVDITKSFTAQILCGLEYLHSKDIIHRDIKGANVLVNGDGVVKISDFGISKKNEYSAYHRMTRLSMQGSIYWMAPEAARGKGYSAKVDIWSCGCLVLEMLTGHVPWHQVRGNIIYLLGTGNAPPIPANLTDDSKNFLQDTFQIDPEKRPTASQFLDHPFTDIDIASVDFTAWTKIAAQQRLEEGSTSEEDAKKTDSEFEDDSDFDEDEDFDEEVIEDDEESNQPTPKSASVAALPVDLSPATPNPEVTLADAKPTETALLAPELLLRVSETSVHPSSGKSSVTDNFSKHTSLQYDDSYDEDFYNVEYSAQEVESLQYLLQTQPDE
ncbi:hypothetical protein HDV06_004411 [Boothiomyces sp. JEL0866]|nr:hypothetical protein HDV06_004411 [Boothiomyces sp. JEL0866]